MMEAMFYQAVCLPPVLDVCPADVTDLWFGGDAITDARVRNTFDAIEEVKENLSKVSSCACPCKSYKVIAMRVNSPGVDPPDGSNLVTQLKGFDFNIAGVSYLQIDDIYNDSNPNNEDIYKNLDLDTWFFADKDHDPITMDDSGNIGLGQDFGVAGHLDFSLLISEWDFREIKENEEDKNNFFQVDGNLADLYESSTCETYEKDIVLPRLSGDHDFGGDVLVKIEVTGKESCPTTVSSSSLS